ncbi:MAG: glycosyltransferase family 4 protein [Candidatus Nanohaloarchaea archaeon]
MTDETRVLHLITRFLNGGAEKTTENTLDALKEADQGYDLRLGFGSEYNEDYVEEIEDKGIDTVCFRWIRHYNPITAVIAVFTVAVYLRREDIDVLHTHSTEAGIIGRIGGWLARTPVIIHEVHGDPIAEDRNSVLNWVILRLEKLTAKVTTRIVVKSKIIRETYLERGIGTEEQYELIYHGVDLEKFKDVEPADLPVSEDSTVLLFVGRLEEGKGLFDLLDAFQRLDVDHRVELCIVGDGELSERLLEEIEDRNIKYVELLGYREDIPQIMSASDILVLPSYREGTPRVITEALASGLPVVSTNIAGIPEQVNDGKTGYLIEPGEINKISTALEQLCQPKIYKRMSKKYTNNIDKFNIKKKQQEYQNLYNNLVS